MSLLTLLAPSVTSTAAAPAIVISQDTNFNGLSLWRITSQNGVITGKRDDRVFGGISNINLGSANYAAPTFGTITGPTTSAASPGLSVDVTITVPFTNIPQDGIVQRIVWLYRTSGTSTWVPWMETTIPGQPSPAASQTITFVYQDLTNSANMDFGCAFVAVSGAAGTAATLASNFALDASSVGPLQNKNLLSNGNFYQNGNPTLASSFGWKIENPSLLSSEASSGSYTVNGVNYTSESLTTTTSGSPGIYQTVNVKPGTTYSYAVMSFNGSTNGHSRVWIGNPGLSSQYNTASDPEPLGSTGAFYSAKIGRYGGVNTQNRGWYLLSGYFTVPNSSSQIAILLQTIANSGSSFQSYWQGAMFWEGTKYQDYVDGENPLGIIGSSTPLNSVCGSIANYAGAPSPSFSATTTSITVAAMSGTITFGDGSTLAYSGGPWPFSSLTASTTYYFNVWITLSNGVVQVTKLGTSPPTSSQSLGTVSDGNLLVVAGISFATPASGTGSGGGNYPGPPSKGCPAIGQMIETKERGLVAAGTLLVGEHLKDPEDGWNQINDLQIVPDTILELHTTEDEPVRVNATHRVMNLLGHWVFVKDLQPGDWLKSADRSIPHLTVTDVKTIGSGHYAAINCDRHRYLLGKAFGHNISY